MDLHADVITRNQDTDPSPGRLGQPDAAEAGAAHLPGPAAVPPPEQAPPAAQDAFQVTSLPPLWTDRPQAWFTSIDCQFAARRITSDSTKFYSVIARLDKDQFVAVEHLARNPPAQGKYARLKETLLNHYADSQERRFRKLVSEIDLGHKRPSALLAEMRRLGGDNLDQAFIQTLWLDRLPRDVQVVLAAADGVQLDAMATLADRMVEIPYDDTTRDTTRDITHSHVMAIKEDRVGKLEKLLLDLYL